MADFAIADLTVTDERKQFVDFTEPFFQTGIAILIHKDNAINITSFRALAAHTDIKYGVLRNSATYNLFGQSNHSTISQIFTTMMENPEVFVESLKEGMDRVNSTRFALIVEQSIAEYIAGKNCQLTYVVDPDIRLPRQYAIALPRDSPYKEAFNSAISQLKSNRVIDRLRTKYWKTCESEPTMS